jgi:hypothetical protein
LATIFDLILYFNEFFKVGVFFVVRICLRSLPLLIIISLLVVILFSLGLNETYDAAQPGPEVTLNEVHSGGGLLLTNTGNLGAGLWSPGTTKSGVIGINSNYSKDMEIDSIGLKIKLSKKVGEGYKPIEDPAIFKEFLKGMKLKIQSNNVAGYDYTYFDQSFYELLYQHGSQEFKGYNLPLQYRFKVYKGKRTELLYTLHMDEEAGNELQDLQATVQFMVNPLLALDLPKDYKYSNCIIELINHDIIQCYPDGTIRLNTLTTRGQMAALAARALELEQSDSSFKVYSDPIPKWVRSYILSLYQKGIFIGYPDKTFRAGKDISRNEFELVLSRAFKAKPNEPIILDSPDKKYVTREETFVTLCKMLGYHAGHSEYAY